jgi:hypothetical protein
MIDAPPRPQPLRARRTSHISPQVDWLRRAAALRGKSLAIALAIWATATRRRTTTVSLGQHIAAEFSVSRDAYYDAVGKLAEAGLIAVSHRGRGRPSTVTLLDGDSRTLAADSLFPPGIHP